MASIIAIIPTEWLAPGFLDDVVLLIASLPVAPEDKKRLIVEWCKYVGVALTRDMVEAAGGGT